MADRKRGDLGGKMRLGLAGAAPVQRRAGEGTASTSGESASEPTVRITVDLSRSQHRALRLFALQHDTDASKVIRAVVDELAAAGVTAEAVIARLSNR